VNDHQLRTLGALSARLVPGPPEDPDPGALEAGAADAIAHFLDAFATAPATIHAARDGGFIALDPVAELGWRIRLEGSRGLPERKFAGPVSGLVREIGEGLALLDLRCREAHGVDFADAQSDQQDATVDAVDDQLGDFVALVLTLTLEAVYGPPQYGGNRGGAGWKPLGWPGFTQPNGFTPAQVSEPETGAVTSRKGAPELGSDLPDSVGWKLASE
jgi:Gluconate 2-dehydrogenase subunit 3